MKYLTTVIVCAMAIIGATVCSANLTSTHAAVVAVSDAEGMSIVGGDPCGNAFQTGVVACGLGCSSEGVTHSCGSRPTSYPTVPGGLRTNASETTTCAICGVTCSTGSQPILIPCSNKP